MVPMNAEELRWIVSEAASGSRTHTVAVELLAARVEIERLREESDLKERVYLNKIERLRVALRDLADSVDPIFDGAAICAALLALGEKGEG